MSDQEAVWAYAVVRAGAVKESDGRLVGVAGRPVRLVNAADLAAVVSPVDLAEFGEEPLRRNLDQLPWLEAVARMHHRVVAAVARSAAVVPMRLATVYRSEIGLTRMLEQRHDDFQAVLSQLAGRSEWGVKVYAAQAVETATPADEGSTGGSVEAGSGAAYLMKRRRQLTAAEEVRRSAVERAEHLHAELAGHAVASAVHRPQDPQLSGTTARMILNASYLVDDRERAAFAAMAEQTAAMNPAVRLELTGPWPPYSFAAAGPSHVTSAGAPR
ncbi:MAG TPA: GvpL/GvpF family gas vesicle protein [Streptosporangiaceae bacterium]|nr:GvpL/GvpF family gas vesicle protein [Streptosporangiaceae bacterium]